jgi:hypothetical protein
MLKLSILCERVAKLVLTTFVFCGVAWGADDPFFGTWTLNVAKSKFDPGPPVRSRTVTVEPAGDGVRWSIEQIDANGNPGTVVETLKFDGKDYPRTVAGSLGGSRAGDTIALQRVDAYTLEETLKKDGQVVATLRQVVSRDGKERTATQMTGTNAAGQPIHNVLVFDKQSR